MQDIFAQPSVTQYTEHALLDWVLHGRLLRYLSRQALQLPLSTRALFGVTRPIIADRRVKPGDIDALLVDPAHPERAASTKGRGSRRSSASKARSQRLSAGERRYRRAHSGSMPDDIAPPSADPQLRGGGIEGEEMLLRRLPGDQSRLSTVINPRRQAGLGQ